MKRQSFFLFSLLLLVASSCFAQPIAHGHSHNDYMQKTPLYDALINGFTSIEADVFLHKKKLIVSHTSVDLDKKKSLEEMYLQPLDSLIKLNRARGYTSDSTPLILMIDFKTSGDETYPYLKELLMKYKDVITSYHQTTIIQRAPIQILITGSKPNVNLLEDTNYVTLDHEIDTRNDASILPYTSRFSSAWETFFSWKGKGKISKEQEALLGSLVTQVHLLKKDIRFYHIPDNAPTWEVLLRNKVDWVNTDSLSQFHQFYLDYKSKTSSK